MNETVEITLDLPSSVFAWLDSHARQRGFPSASAFVRKLLIETMSIVQAEDKDFEAGAAMDEELIAEHLRALGYIE